MGTQQGRAAATAPPIDADGETLTVTRFFTLTGDGERVWFLLQDDWVLPNIAELEKLLDRRRLRSLPGSRVGFECSALRQFDLAGAWLLYRTGEQLRELGYRIELQGFRDEHLRFIEEVLDIDISHEHAGRPTQPLTRLAGWTDDTLRALAAGLTQRLQWGLRVARAALATLVHPRRLRWIATARHIQDAGISALGIVALMSFLVALVLGFQSQVQLVKFGAQIFTVDLVSLSILREMGALLTAILVAGRSGSAFAAEIGVMRLNEEVDAMQTLGVDPIEALIIPRLLALLLCLPLLTFIADIAGLLGMLTLTSQLLDIPTALAVDRFLGLDPLRHFLAGLVKTPFFALVIVMIGTYRGYHAERSAGAVGRNTTAAVVESVFSVIVVDALFSILFTELGW